MSFAFGAPVASSDVLIELKTPKNGRRVQVISAVLQAMHLSHVARVPFWRPGLLPSVMRKRLAKTGCRVVWRGTGREKLLITDDPGTGRGTKRIVISYDTRVLREGRVAVGDLALPIMFNPSLLNPEAYRLAAALAERKERPIKVIFAGNCDPKAYDEPEIASRYGLFSRHRLHRFVWEAMAGQMYFPESYEQLIGKAAAGELRDRFVWVDTARFSIPMTEWLQVMSMSQYFFCAPGVAYPYCHNFNESAACGCVPILQYGDWLFPHLESGVNCFGFATTDGLAALLGSLLSGEHDNRWAARSAAIVAYHCAYLSLDSCMRQLREFLADDERSTMTWIMAGKAGKR